MRLRTRLSIAFFLISVVPLAVVTAYSYYSSASSLRRAAEAQADQMATEMGDRMTWVMTDLGDRVERLWRMRVDEPASGGGTPPASAAGAGQMAADQQAANLQNVAKAMLAEAAPLVRRLEFTSTGVLKTAAGPGVPAGTTAATEAMAGRQSRTTAAATSTGAPTATAGADSGRRRRGSGRFGEPGGPGFGGRMDGAPPPLLPGGPDMPGPPPGGAPPGPRGDMPPSRGVPVLAPGRPRVVVEMPPVRIGTGTAAADSAFESLSPDAINAWRRAIQRQVDRETELRTLFPGGQSAVPAAPVVPPAPSAPPASGAPPVPGAVPPAAAGPEGPRPPAIPAEVMARLQEDRARRAQERVTHMAALARGQALQFQVRRAGEVIGEINATVDRNRLIETVLSLGRRDRGEIPFVLDAAGKVHTIDAAAVKTIQNLALDATARVAHASSTTQMAGDYLVVTRKDPSGIVFGLARPIRDSLRDMRRASLRNLAVGLFLIAGAFAIALPLASRLTRHITALNAGVQKLAAGDRRARVEEGAPDEIGDLARSFNRMASELESHDQILAKQERLARELELCRQIQNEMLPHGPLKTALMEVAGVSVPAREVGGDFFNYFALEDGRIALLVGDVSGKGVGAALLMANVQATLRAKLQLESDLAHLAASVDRDIAANTPPEVYITLFVGLLNPAGRELRYVNAGHNPQFLLRAAGGLERLESTGLPVGLLPGRGYEERSVPVDAGDLLFLYTDGAVEAPNEAGDFFNIDRLQDELLAASAAGVDEVLVRVEQAIRGFRGHAEPADDATMMALRLSPPAAA